MYPTPFHGAGANCRQQRLPNGEVVPHDGGYPQNAPYYDSFEKRNRAAVNPGSPQRPPSDADQLSVYDGLYGPSSPSSSTQSPRIQADLRLRCPIKAAERDDHQCSYTGTGFKDISKTREHIARYHPSYCRACAQYVSGSTNWNAHKKARLRLRHDGTPEKCPMDGVVAKVDTLQTLWHSDEFLNSFHARQPPLDKTSWDAVQYAWQSLYRQLFKLGNNEPVPSAFQCESQAQALSPGSSSPTASPSTVMSPTLYEYPVSSHPPLERVSSIQSVLQTGPVGKSMYQDGMDTAMFDVPTLDLYSLGPEGSSQIRPSPGGHIPRDSGVHFAVPLNTEHTHSDGGWSSQADQGASFDAGPSNATEQTDQNQDRQRLLSYLSTIGFPEQLSALLHRDNHSGSTSDTALMFKELLKALEQLTAERNVLRSSFEDAITALRNTKVHGASQLIHALNLFRSDRATAGTWAQVMTAEDNLCARINQVASGLQSTTISPSDEQGI